MKRWLFVAIFFVACGGGDVKKPDTLHEPPVEETAVESTEVETPPDEPEFPEAILRLVDEVGKTRLHVDPDGSVIAKGQTIGTLQNDQFANAKGQVVMEVKKGKLMVGGKDLGKFSDDDMSVTTPDGMIGLDDNGQMVSRINKSSEVYRSEWRFPEIDESQRRHAIILAIAFQSQMQLKEQK